MRSSDLWLGWPYDIFNFTILTTLIGLELKARGLTLELGDISLQAGSQHLYSKNLDAAMKCMTDRAYLKYSPLSIELFESADHLRNTLEKIKGRSKESDYWLSDLH
jgi:thymidylate synthase